jgi:hypothetical protein
MFTAIFILPESPRFLYSKHKYIEARASLNYMATFNGNKQLGFFLFDNEIETDEQKEKRKLQEQLMSIETKMDNDEDSDIEKDDEEEENKQLLSQAPSCES